MAKRQGTATPTAERVTRRRKSHAADEPAIDGVAAKRLSIGIVIAMCAAAGISAQGQFQLGVYLGLGQLAWLMPVAFDVYAGTLTLVAVKVPAGHGKRRAVVWNARLALAVSIAGNATSHAIKLGDLHHGWTLRDSVLVVISALPPVVVERLLHVYLIVNPGNGNHATETVATVAGATIPVVSAPVASTAPATSPTVVAAAGGSPPAQLIPRDKQLAVVRRLVLENRDVTLSTISDTLHRELGINPPPHKSTASRFRARVIADLKAASDADKASDQEPERAAMAGSWS